MKELDSFTVERLGEIKNAFLDCHKETAPSIGEIFALIDIALAAKRAEPIGYLEQNHLDYLQSGSDADIWPEGGAGDIPVYLAPQLNSPEIPEGWISCSDRMPENDMRKPVAVYTGNYLGQGMFVASYDDNEFSDYWEGTEIDGVTHWMPLPTAPEKP
ncbi:DUF551 domain-containing protein [Yersinia massiliensis]|uniref:DUF551 domain-containing protein n=1 Tax=Yersinia massiliensis TaxID=419257 RepID=UPI0002DE2E95|nr:DUF551 domain-containing protein [Yersinia massiliensis]